MFELETERLLITHLTFSDAPFILELVNSEGWLSYIGDRNIHSISDAEHYLKTGPIKSYHKYEFGLFRVALKNSNTPIGINGILKRPELEHPDLGFAFLPYYQGNGYAYESSSAILDWVESEKILTELLAITKPENVRSKKLLSKLGFRITDSMNNSCESLLTFKNNFG